MITPFRCNKCDNETWRLVYSIELGIICCLQCNEENKISTRSGITLGFSSDAHPSERAVVWERPDGHISYPMRNSDPIPERYQAQGYVRKELPTLRSIENFEKSHNVRSEVAWCDKGKGTGHE